MRTIECNICGEPLSAATDEELLGRMLDHMRSEHPDSQADEGTLRETIAAEAYEATDS